MDHHGNVEQAIKTVEGKLLNVKRTILELLALLEMQEQVSWSQMITLFCTLSNQFSSLQTTMSSTGMGDLFKTHLVVPQSVSLEPDRDLQKDSEGRLISWNHEVVPNYLRAKLTPEAEVEFRKIEGDSSGKQSDYLTKQMKLFNQHIETISAKLKQQISVADLRQQPQPTFSQMETTKMVRALFYGTGLQPKNKSGENSFSDSRTTTPVKKQ